jgi:hypothetical protein
MSVNVNKTLNQVRVVESPSTNTVGVIATGPQGPGFYIDESSKINKSVIYYDSSAGEFKADATWTVETLVLGGNF